MLPLPNDAWVAFSDGSKTWADPTCASAVAGRTGVQTVPWSTIAAEPTVTAPFTCTQLLGLIAVVVPPAQSAVPVFASELLVSPDRARDGQDGFVRLSDGTRTWASATCRHQLIEGGVPFVITPWTSTAALPTAPGVDCGNLAPAAPRPLGAPDANGAMLVMTADKYEAAQQSDGWLYMPDGTAQWASAACAATLSAAGIKTVVTSWSTVAGLPGASTPQDCSGVNPAAEPLSILATGDITPEQGGVVTSPDGTALSVPAGVVPSATNASITTMSNGSYDVHIAGPWSGNVQVTVPLAADGDEVLHQIAGVWLPEAPGVGASSVTVTVNKPVPADVSPEARQQASRDRGEPARQGHYRRDQ